MQLQLERFRKHGTKTELKFENKRENALKLYEKLKQNSNNSRNGQIDIAPNVNVRWTPPTIQISNTMYVNMCPAHGQKVFAIVHNLSK